MKFKAILFDIDGTIISLNPVVKSLQAACRALGLRALSKKEIYDKIIGIKISKFFPQLFPENKEKQDEFRKIYYSKYLEISPKPFPGVKKVFAALKKKKIKIGILTTTQRARSKPVLEKAGLPYDCLVAMDDVKEVKPSPEPVLLAIKKLNVKPTETLVIGDTIFDILAGKQAGCKTCGITTGKSTERELLGAGADFVIKNIYQVLDLIKN